MLNINQVCKTVDDMSMNFCEGILRLKNYNFYYLATLQILFQTQTFVYELFKSQHQTFSVIILEKYIYYFKPIFMPFTVFDYYAFIGFTREPFELLTDLLSHDVNTSMTDSISHRIP